MFSYSVFGFGDTIEEALMFSRMNHLSRNKTGSSSICNIKDVYEIKVPEDTDHSLFHQKMMFAMMYYHTRKDRIPTMSEKRGYDYVQDKVGGIAMNRIIDAIFDQPEKCVGFCVFQHNFDIPREYKNMNIYRFIF